MAVPGLGCKGHDFEANQAGGHQLDRNDFYPPTAADLECQSTFGASFCGIAPVEAGHDSARCHEGNAMKLEISLRSAEANELHALIQRLVGNGITQLILVRISPTGLQRSPLAVALSQRLKG